MTNPTAEPIVEATGDLDLATAPALRSRLYAEVDANPGATVVLDLRGATFIDSTGLGVMVGALKRARTAGGELAIIPPAANLWKVFTVTGLDKVFQQREPVGA